MYHKLIKKLSIVVTVYNSAAVLVSLILTAMCFHYCNAIEKGISYAADGINSADGNNVADGYMVWGSMLFGAFGFLGEMILYIIAVVLIFAALYNLLPGIIGILTLTKSKKRLNEDKRAYAGSFKADGIIKTIFNGLPCLILMLFTLSNADEIEAILLVIDFLYISAVVASVLQIIYSRKLLESL